MSFYADIVQKNPASLDESSYVGQSKNGLLGSGQANKYLLYAIGEIALVVIGILIAQQINNWNEWKKDWTL